MNKKIIGDRYQVIYLLGKKPGYRTVLCSDTQTQRLVVVKFLVWDDDFEWQNLKLFEREAEVLKSISHPAIPRYLDYFEVNKPQLKGFGLVQTYIKAESLEKHLQAGRTFSIKEVKQLAESVLKILIYLHSQQPSIIHRDIKPSNILLTNRSGNSIGKVYLIDFGSVKTLATAESNLTVVGTYGYMSPEQFGGKVVPKSDLYSLGATLTYLMTGMHPADLPQKDGKIQFEKLINCSDDFANWLKRMVEPVSELRFASAKAALHSLKQPLIKTNTNYLTNKKTPIKKPFGSKVNLKKGKNKLEIIIPPRGNSKLKDNLVFFVSKFLTFAIKMLLLILTSVLFFSIILYGPVFPIFTYIYISLLLYALLFILCGGIYLMYIALIVTTIKNLIKTLINLFQGERLQIEPNRITSSSDWLCFKGCFPRSMYLFRTNIDKLEKVFIPENNNSKWGIAANVGGNKYKIAPKGNLTEVEIDWLCKELSEYFNIPLEDS